MLKILPLLFLLAGAGIGAGAGWVLHPPVQADEDDASAGEKPDSSPEESGTEYVKLNNQFVVPVIERDRVAALVVMSLSLETRGNMTEAVYEVEPKLRDAFLRVLFDHSNMGGFRGAFTRSDQLDLLRKGLREVARQELGDDITDVLIVDIARQDT